MQKITLFKVTLQIPFIIVLLVTMRVISNKPLVSPVSPIFTGFTDFTDLTDITGFTDVGESGETGESGEIGDTGEFGVNWRKSVSPTVRWIGLNDALHNQGWIREMSLSNIAILD